MVDKDYMQQIRNGLIVALLATAVCVGLVMIRFGLQATTTAAVAKPLAESTAAQLYLLTFQAARIEKKVYETSEEQRLYWKVISHQTSAAVRLFDLNMNGGVDVKTKKAYSGVLPDLDAVLKSTKTSVDAVGTSVVSLTQHANGTLDQATGAVGDSRVMLGTFNRAIKDFDLLIADPAWHALLVNAQATSFHTAGAMKHFDTMAELSEARLRQLFKPGNFAKDLILRALGVASQSRTLFTGH